MKQVSKSSLFLSFFIGVFITEARSQKVKFIKNPVAAQYRVFISNKPKGATHWIYRVSNPTDLRRAGDWYIVTNPQLFKEAVTLYEVMDRKEADWIVYYVSTRDSARIFYGK